MKWKHLAFPFVLALFLINPIFCTNGIPEIPKAPPELLLLFAGIYIYSLILLLVLGLRLKEKIFKEVLNEIVYSMMLSWVITLVISTILLSLGIPLQEFFILCLAMLMIVSLCIGVIYHNV